MKIGGFQLLFATVMVGLLVSSYFLVFQKNDQKRLAKIAEKDAKERALVELLRSTRGIDDLGSKIGDVQNAINTFQAMLPAEKEFDTVLREISQLANNCQLTTKSVRTLKTERANGYSEQPITMSVSGNFKGFYSFMLQLEAMKRITRVSQMKLTKLQERDGELDATLTLSIFFAPDVDTAPAAGVIATAQ